jgi:CheY-like chemotaxis protein
MASIGRKTIVVVDDSEICLEVARLALERRGHQVLAFDSPFGLPKVLNEMRPDLVLLDVNMPALQGDKVAAIVLKSRRYRCPIVFLSDRPSAELAALTASCGATGHINKTDDLDALADAVERYLTP